MVTLPDMAGDGCHAYYRSTLGLDHDRDRVLALQESTSQVGIHDLAVFLPGSFLEWLDKYNSRHIGQYIYTTVIGYYTGDYL